MAILFFTEGDSRFGESNTCSGGPRKSKPINLTDLKNLTRVFYDRTQLTDMPTDLRNNLLVGCRFPIQEVAMLISQNPGAKYLQVNYAIDGQKHFHYMVATEESAAIETNDTTLIIEDCCRIPPNTININSFF